MNKTADEFKRQQAKALELLNKTEKFIMTGEELGVDIDSSLKKKIQEAKNSTTDKLKVALVGGFSEGKTTIAAAWLEKIDKGTMKISYQESSNEIVVYEHGDIEIIDTPGLFGFKDTENKEKYKDITKKYVSESNLIIYVMDPTNPIKDSHKDELLWLFRTLNLLSRTIFVLSRFDEIADLEDEDNYNENYQIKKDNVSSRLEQILDLSSEEKDMLSIVAVSANPFNMSLDHWLNNKDEFAKLSHIKSLQEATEEKIVQNGGSLAIINETKKSVVSDILHKQMPIADRKNYEISKEIQKLEDLNEVMSNKLNNLNKQIVDARINLKKFIKDYFDDLIEQTAGLSLETIDKFIIRNIGEKGINIEVEVKNAFQRETNSINIELQKASNTFMAEVDSFETAMKLSFGEQGLKYLSNAKIDNHTILLARDAIVSGAKFIGFDISKILTFKPWGAINLASKANFIFAIIGVAFEIYQHFKEKEIKEAFEKAQKDMRSKFTKQKEELLKFIDSDDFIASCFAYFENLKNAIDEYIKATEGMRQQQDKFKQWKDDGEIIEAEILS